jgi:hypothetical protein
MACWVATSKLITNRVKEQLNKCEENKKCKEEISNINKNLINKFYINIMKIVGYIKMCGGSAPKLNMIDFIIKNKQDGEEIIAILSKEPYKDIILGIVSDIPNIQKSYEDDLNNIINFFKYIHQRRFRSEQIKHSSIENFNENDIKETIIKSFKLISKHKSFNKLSVSKKIKLQNNQKSPNNNSPVNSQVVTGFGTSSINNIKKIKNNKNSKIRNSFSSIVPGFKLIKK